MIHSFATHLKNYFLVGEIDNLHEKKVKMVRFTSRKPFSTIVLYYKRSLFLIKISTKMARQKIKINAVSTKLAHDTLKR
jgi:hypothetical protein